MVGSVTVGGAGGRGGAGEYTPTEQEDSSGGDTYESMDTGGGY